ncbi:alpha/beta hydrolase [Nocardia sp. NPDC051570]|uniref:alpha/beta hydrolase n=1 Tax=Nocardia sp. NPDC051570 TaxID=3364324 RepID=UPI0037920BDF
MSNWPKVFTHATRAIAVAMLLAASGCGGSRAESGQGIDRYLHQRPDWESCENYSGGGKLGASGFDCAHVTVPIDYDKPEGDTARIAISRHKALGARIASLLTNPGGPGVPGLASLPQRLAKTPLGVHFDLIGVDVRGLGASTPKVICRTLEQARAHREEPTWDLSPTGIARTEQQQRDLVADCVRRTGTDLLRHIGTADVARDFDVIRSVLGDEKLAYYGGSYGSRLGSTIAEMYPDRVRAIVVDAALDPTAPIVDEVGADAGLEHAFETYATDCAHSDECPVGTDPTRAPASLRELVTPLQQHPAATSDGRGLGYRGASTAVINALYTPEAWEIITKGLNELRDGHGDLLARFTDIIEGVIGRDLQHAVLCGEEPRLADRATAADLDRRTRTVAPAFDDGHATGQAPLPLCAFWPFPPFTQPHVPDIHGLPKTVVVATTGDPVAPYAGGRNLAHYLGASLITYEDIKHGGAFDGISCIDEPLTRYLIDLMPPPAETTCRPH